MKTYTISHFQISEPTTRRTGFDFISTNLETEDKFWVSYNINMTYTELKIYKKDSDSTNWSPYIGSVFEVFPYVEITPVGDNLPLVENLELVKFLLDLDHETYPTGFYLYTLTKLRKDMGSRSKRNFLEILKDERERVLVVSVLTELTPLNLFSELTFSGSSFKDLLRENLVSPNLILDEIFVSGLEKFCRTFRKEALTLNQARLDLAYIRGSTASSPTSEFINSFNWSHSDFRKNSQFLQYCNKIIQEHDLTPTLTTYEFLCTLGLRWVIPIYLLYNRILTRPNLQKLQRMDIFAPLDWRRVLDASLEGVYEGLEVIQTQNPLGKYDSNLRNLLQRSITIIASSFYTGRKVDTSNLQALSIFFLEPRSEMGAYFKYISYMDVVNFNKYYIDFFKDIKGKVQNHINNLYVNPYKDPYFHRLFEMKLQVDPAEAEKSPRRNRIVETFLFEFVNSLPSDYKDILKSSVSTADDVGVYINQILDNLLHGEYQNAQAKIFQSIFNNYKDIYLNPTHPFPEIKSSSSSDAFSASLFVFLLANRFFPGMYDMQKFRKFKAEVRKELLPTGKLTAEHLGSYYKVISYKMEFGMKGYLAQVIEGLLTLYPREPEATLTDDGGFNYVGLVVDSTDNFESRIYYGDKETIAQEEVQRFNKLVQDQGCNFKFKFFQTKTDYFRVISYLRTDVYKYCSSSGYVVLYMEVDQETYGVVLDTIDRSIIHVQGRFKRIPDLEVLEELNKVLPVRLHSI